MRQNEQQQWCSATRDASVDSGVYVAQGDPRQLGLWRAARDRMAAPAASN